MPHGNPEGYKTRSKRGPQKFKDINAKFGGARNPMAPRKSPGGFPASPDRHIPGPVKMPAKPVRKRVRPMGTKRGA
jgi:hypothetical protein